MQLYSKFNVLVVQLKLWEENFCPEKTHKWKMMEKILKQLFVEKHSSYATAHYPTVKATLLYMAGWKLTASSDIM